MRTVHAGDVAEAQALVDAAHAALHDQRRSLREAGEALRATAMLDGSGRRHAYLTTEVLSAEITRAG